MPRKILHTGFSQIFVGDDHFRSSTLKKGQDLLAAQHVGNVREIQEPHHVTVTGECLPETSINNRPYALHLEMESTRNVTALHCECTAGVTGTCKHAAALVLFINKERCEGCTDKAQQWKVPSRKKQELYPKGKTIEEIEGQTPLLPCTFSASEEHRKKLVEDMAKFGMTNAALYKSLTAQPREEEEEQPPSDSVALPFEIVQCLFQEILVGEATESSPGSTFSPGNLNLWEKIKCTHVQAAFIFHETMNQSLCKRWYEERMYRITASRAHKILHARKESTSQSYFFRSLQENSNLRYGRETEPVAKEKYKAITGNTLIPVGLFVKPSQPWLAATPDAVTKDKNGNLYVLEVKCPSSCKNKDISVPYLTPEGLKTSHEYFTQIQLELYCCNLEKAHFFVYSNKQEVLVEISRDDSFL